jgi:hypothetical protein
MRMSQLAEWVAGGVAGCPGTVDVTTLDDSPTPTSASQGRVTSVIDPPTELRPRRSRWITAAAAILVAEGGLGILYLPVLTSSSMWPLQPLAILIVGLSVLNVAAGIGLLFLRGWARLVAGALSSFVLLFMYAPALMAAVANDVWLGFDWLGIVAYLVVLFAVQRRWPTELTDQIAAPADARTS